MSEHADLEVDQQAEVGAEHWVPVAVQCVDAEGGAGLTDAAAPCCSAGKLSPGSGPGPVLGGRSGKRAPGKEVVHGAQTARS